VGTPLEQAERQAIREALARFAGNRRQTAEFLGMSVRNLLYKLKKLGLSNRESAGS
jgi:DNA-binding NtrC family response regulator